MSDLEKLWAIDYDKPATVLRGFDRYRVPLPTRRSLEVLPGMYSFDPEVLDAQRALSKELNEHPRLQVNVDEKNMIGENAIHQNFDKIRTVAGYGSNPLTWVSVDNTLLIEGMGLPNDFRNDRHRLIFDELCDIAFGNWLPTSLKVPKLSTFGPGALHVFDGGYKRDYAIWAYSKIDHIRSLFRARDFRTLSEQYGIVFLFNANIRGQVDAPGKVREVNDFEFAMSGGRKGNRIVSDKKVVIDGVEYPDFSAMRMRVIQGVQWPINCILQCVFGGHMYALFELFPKVFHHTDTDTVAEDAAKAGDSSWSDVVQYDETYADFMISRMFQQMKKYWAEDLIDMAEVLLHSGYFSRPVDINEKRGRFIVGSDPLDPTTINVKAGNRSGWAGTSFMAKFGKVFDTLAVIDDLTNNVVGNVKSYLEDREIFKIRNNGDDEGVLSTPDNMSRYREYRYRSGKDNPGYFVVEEEVGSVFSGAMIDWKKGKSFPRPHNFLERLYVPERSIGGTFRKNWPLGVIDRMHNLEKHPEGDVIFEIHRKVYRDHLEPKYGRFGEMLVTALESIEFNYDSLTAIDREVLESPEKIHYKFSESAVSEHILDQIVTKIKPEEFSWVFDNYRGFVL